MSLLAKQQWGMLTVEKMALQKRLIDEVEPALSKENTKRNRKAKQDILDRLSAINRQLQQTVKDLDAAEAAEKLAEEAKAVAAAKKAEEAAKKAEATRPKKLAPPKGKSICCVDCEQDFFFGKGEQAFYAEKGFPEPTRCRDCRAAKKAAALKPVLINCSRCSVDFTFSVGAQKHFKEQGWKDPVRCKKCREEHKSETSSRASTAAGGGQ